MYKCYCDYCKTEINSGAIKLDGQGINVDGVTWFSKHYHPDCFNYLLSTDWKRAIIQGKEK